MRKRKEFAALLDEVPGVSPRNVSEQSYEVTTVERRSSFAGRREDMFYKNFEYRLHGIESWLSRDAPAKFSRRRILQERIPAHAALLL